jgi:glycosyltransferase involved in cell wall biosynthesis
VCGRPVITTNVRAFPEINNDDRGWLITVNKREIGGEASFRNDKDRAALSASIKKGVKVIVEDILANPQQIRDKGALALAHILSHHNQKNFGQSLEALYHRA